MMLKGKMFVSKIDRGRVLMDEDGREYVNIVIMLNDKADYSGKRGVIMQNTSSDEKRIYLSNLYVLHEGDK